MASRSKGRLVLDIFLGVITLGLYFLIRSSGGSKSKTREWLDAIVFAVLAAAIIRTFFIEAFTIPSPSMEKSLMIGDFLFVSKLNYGPRIPNTPLSFPFAHHTMPYTGGKSYLEWVKIPYYRFPGFQDIRNNDVVVFNYPMEDFRPVDKQENYIKRCVAIPGDTLKIVDRQVFINGKAAAFPAGVQFDYHVKTSGADIDSTILEEFEIKEGGRISSQGDFLWALTPENAEKLKAEKNIVTVQNLPVDEIRRMYSGSSLFPGDKNWDVDNYGPLVVPKKGMTVKLSKDNISLYRRIISVYEHNNLSEKDSKFYINDKETDQYTFRMNYYFMMGDNRHNSMDSRFWGFVPEDHVVGKAVFVWMSWNTYGNAFSKIRWNRVFRFIK